MTLKQACDKYNEIPCNCGAPEEGIHESDGTIWCINCNHILAVEITAEVEQRIAWLQNNLTAVEIKAGFNAIQTLLDLELSFTPTEQDALDQALQRGSKVAIKHYK